MKLIIRAFCKVPVIKSPISAYLADIKDKNFVAEILKKQREEIPKFKDQQVLLKDLELPSIFRMKEFTNQRLITVVKAYSIMNQGSSQLFETISKQIKKRINSFTLEELSTIVFFLSTTPNTFEILDIIHTVFVSDPLEIPAEVIGKLSFAYSLQKPNGLQLHRALANIFIASKEKVSPENGFLLLTGFYRIKYNDPMLVPHIQEWCNKNWEEFDANETAHMIFVLFKLKMLDFAKKKVNELELDHFSALDIEKIVGSFVENDLNVPRPLLDYLLKLLKDFKISSADIVGIVYLLNDVQGTEEHFSALEKILEKTMHLINSVEKLHIFTSFIVSHKENERVLELFAKDFAQGGFTEQITTVFPALIRRKSLFLPYTQGLIDMLYSQIQGKVLKTQELMITMYALSLLKYQNDDFWAAALTAVTVTKITSAEEYIQIKKTVKEIGKIGVDVSHCISILESAYESNN